MQGLTGITGNNGWYVQFHDGSPQELQLFMIQVPIGTSVMFATRYPSGVHLTFLITASLQLLLRKQMLEINQFSCCRDENHGSERISILFASQLIPDVSAQIQE